jgi:hypothetical protein
VIETLYLVLFLEFQAIGAEYGEGFETFRADGPLKVDVVRIFFIHYNEIFLSMYSVILQKGLVAQLVVCLPCILYRLIYD